MSAAGGVGCVAMARYIPTNAPPRALYVKDPDRVEILSSGPPSRAHADIGIIELTNQDDERFSLIRAEAAKHGCDAVVIGFMGHRADPYATCIVYTSDD